MSQSNQNKSIKKIGVVAGRGILPKLLIENLESKGMSFYIIALRGFVDDWVQQYSHDQIGMGQVGRLFKILERNGCDTVLICGAVKRPCLSSLRFDLTGIRILLQSRHLLKRGDDQLLTGIARIFADKGITIDYVQNYLTECLMPAGALGEYKPSNQDDFDIKKARTIIETISPLDIGQATVVKNGLCEAIEVNSGTDVMLENLILRQGNSSPAGVLYKAPKVGQDMRLDVPTIGLQTIKNIHKANLNGIAAKVGSVFVLEPEKVIEYANKHALFLYGIE